MNEMQLGRKFGNGEVVVSSLDIAELTGKRHADVMRDIRVEVSNLGEELGQRIFSQSYYTNKQNKKQPCYEFSKKGAMQLALKYDAMTRFKVIEYIEMLESELKPKLPTTYRDALAELLHQVDENERLALENEQMKPKALFSDAVSASETSILIGSLAKLIKQNGVNIGQNRLYEWLRQNGYLIKRKGDMYNSPTQRSMDMGLFEVKVRTIVNPDDTVRTTRTTMVTGKGQVYFVNKFVGGGGQ